MWVSPELSFCHTCARTDARTNNTFLHSRIIRRNSFVKEDFTIPHVHTQHNTHINYLPCVLQINYFRRCCIVCPTARKIDSGGEGPIRHLLLQVLPHRPGGRQPWAPPGRAAPPTARTQAPVGPPSRAIRIFFGDCLAERCAPAVGGVSVLKAFESVQKFSDLSGALHSASLRQDAPKCFFPENVARLLLPHYSYN